MSSCHLHSAGVTCSAELPCHLLAPHCPWPPRAALHPRPQTFQAALRHNRHLRVFVDSSRDAISRTERTLIFGLSALALLGFNTFLYFILYEVVRLPAPLLPLPSPPPPA